MAANAVTAYGLLGLAGMQLALPLTVLREVIPAPARLEPLPASAPGLLGAVELRDRVIPVLDLGHVLGTADAEGQGDVIAVAFHQGRVIGLLAEGVLGITSVAGDALQEMATESGELLFSHSFTRPEDDSICSLLDIDALFRLAGVPALRDGPSGDRAVAGLGAGLGLGTGDGSRDGSGDGFDGAAIGDDAIAGRTRPVMLVRCGELHLAIDAVAVHTVLPSVRLEASPLRAGSCLGAVRYRQTDIPAVDPLQVLDLGELDPDDASQGILLAYPQGLVVLLLSEVIDIVAVSPDRFLGLPPMTVRRPDFFSAVLPLGGRQYLVLADRQLLAEPQLVGLSACNTGAGATASDPPPSAVSSAGGSSSAGSAVAGSAVAGSAVAGSAAAGEWDGAAHAGTSYLTYSIGSAAGSSGGPCDVATPLEQVVEILPFDEERAVLGTGRAPVLGFIVHRNQTVPVVDLAAQLGRPALGDRSSACVLLVPVHGVDIGYLVPALHAIERSVWEEERPSDPGQPGQPGQPGKPGQTGQPGQAGLTAQRGPGDLGSAPMLRVGEGEELRMIPFVDLVALAGQTLDELRSEPGSTAGRIPGQSSPAGREERRALAPRVE